MKKMRKSISINRDSDRERGAALVTVLIMTGFLMVAGSALLYVASMQTANVTDAVADEQAYYAAESGVQMTLNVLRGNVVPNPLLNTAVPATDPLNKINYRRALSLSSSNAPNDAATLPQLSRWIPYSFVNNSSNVSAIGTGLPNQPAGLGFRVNIEDPSNATNSITFATTASFSNPSGANVTINNGNPSSFTFGTGANSVVITFAPKTATTLNVVSGSANTDLGNFQIVSYGSGAALSNDVRFAIVYKMSAPLAGSRVVRGWIRKSTNVNSTSVGSLTIDFDAKIYELAGGSVNITSNDPLTPNAPNVNAGRTPVLANITQIMPQRIVVRSTGFGPRGAQKQLEAFVQKDVFGGLTAPATITMVGAPSGFNFDSGSSNAKTYSGTDAENTGMMIPPVGTAVPGFNADSISIDKGTWGGTPSDVTDELPDWLQSPTNLDNTIKWLKLIATSSGRYYPSGVAPPNLGGITFIDGDISLHQSGSGVLVCTGTLTFNGNPDFQGLVIVTGDGGVVRNGGGNGSILGNVVVAPYDPNNLTAAFKSPKFVTSGGGNSTVQYDSKSAFDAMNGAGNIVIGIAQK